MFADRAPTGGGPTRALYSIGRQIDALADDVAALEQDDPDAKPLLDLAQQTATLHRAYFRQFKSFTAAPGEPVLNALVKLLTAYASVAQRAGHLDNQAGVQQLLQCVAEAMAPATARGRRAPKTAWDDRHHVTAPAQPVTSATKFAERAALRLGAPPDQPPPPPAQKMTRLGNLVKTALQSRNGPAPKKKPASASVPTRRRPAQPSLSSSAARRAATSAPAARPAAKVKIIIIRRRRSRRRRRRRGWGIICWLPLPFLIVFFFSLFYFVALLGSSVEGGQSAFAAAAP